MYVSLILSYFSMEMTFACHGVCLAMLIPNSLQQRLYAYLLIPVTLLLFVAGTVGFIFSRNSMLSQWQETAILELERLAHQVDMRLMKVKDMMQLFGQTGINPNSFLIQSLIVENLKQQEGVKQVLLEWHDNPESQSHRPVPGRQSSASRDMSNPARSPHSRGFHHASKIQVLPPHYDAVVQYETVSLVSSFSDDSNRKVGQLSTVVGFNHLIEDFIEAGWWQSYKAYLLDDTGRILISANVEHRQDFQSTATPLELKAFQRLQENPYGTVMGGGHPPKEIAGFFRLQQAPWTFVIIAPGKDILLPITDFRNYFVAFGTLFLLVIVALIRFVTGRTVSAIRKVSEAARYIAAGRYDTKLPPQTRDEVGELIASFNQMTGQLEERSRLKEAMHVAMEVQQNLLPQKGLAIDGLDIAGGSIYCDETGGDYYDYFQNRDQGPITVAVGDVAGHGIGAALLMTTVRAMIRSRTLEPGTLGQKISDINRLLCLDTRDSGNFMTLFMAELDTQQRTIRWVRAGHDPALLYDPSGDRFKELTGDGIVLGIDDSYCYQEYAYEQWTGGLQILIGTDGIWETENEGGERFGKQRLKNIVRRHSHGSAEDMIQAVADELFAFRGAEPQHDDMTLVVIKIDKKKPPS